MLSFGLVPNDRAWLHQRIAQRFDQMLAAGLIDEVHALRHKYRLDVGFPSMRCVGYRQVWEVIEGRLPANELRDRGIFATRQFAKRQLTWLNGWPDITLMDCQNAGMAATIRASIDRFSNS